MVLLCLTAASASAQRHFFFDQPESFRHPVKLPREVLPLLRREVDAIAGCNEKPSKEAPSFTASRINLGANRPGIIVRVFEDCSHSADNFWFWILLKTRRGYRSLLRAGTVSVTVRNARAHGFPNIETNAATAEGNYTNVYKFDGSVYKVDMCTHTSFATRKTERVTCRPQ